MPVSIEYIRPLPKKQLEIVLSCVYYKYVHLGKRIKKRTFLTWKPKCSIKKISKNLYMKGRWLKTNDGKIFKPNDSGEVFEMKQKKSKVGMRSIRSLRKIIKDMRNLIQNNFSENDGCQMFVTLTYAENMTEPKRLYNDFKLFWRKLQRRYHGNKLEYIAVSEPQGRGAWHMHVLIRAENKLDLSDTDELGRMMYNECWDCKGWVTVESLSNVDHVGAYFSAYLSGMEIPDGDEAIYEVDPDDIEEKNGKKYIKGERLKYYPDYMKLYRNSRGIEKPFIEDGEMSDRTKKHYLDDVFQVANGDAKVRINNEQKMFNEESKKTNYILIDEIEVKNKP
jgi:hypothetical protein